MNAETKWTPGPWKAEHCDDGAWMVCTDGNVIVVDDSHLAEANARLIAAAPEMAEALANLRAHVSFDARTDSQEKLDAMRAADAALSKAGG